MNDTSLICDGCGYQFPYMEQHQHNFLNSSQPQLHSQGIRCQNCNSGNIQYVSDTVTKGFGTGKGCCGYILFGPYGWLCGLSGMGKSTTHTYWICKNCGCKFQA